MSSRQQSQVPRVTIGLNPTTQPNPTRPLIIEESIVEFHMLSLMCSRINMQNLVMNVEELFLNYGELNFFM